jgi:hypothetical protein
VHAHALDGIELVVSSWFDDLERLKSAEVTIEGDDRCTEAKRNGGDVSVRYEVATDLLCATHRTKDTKHVWQVRHGQVAGLRSHSIDEVKRVVDGCRDREDSLTCHDADETRPHQIWNEERLSRCELPIEPGADDCVVGVIEPKGGDHGADIGDDHVVQLILVKGIEQSAI